MANSEGIPRLAYRVREVQAALGIGRDLVYDLINSGQLAHVKAGNAMLVPAHALEKFLGVDVPEAPCATKMAADQ